MDKKELRKEIRARIGCLSADEKAINSKETCALAAQLPEWRRAENVMLFLSLPDEIDTSFLISEALKSGKTVYVPKVQGEVIEVYEYSPSHLAKGAFGILEPTPDALRLDDFGALRLIFVPGVAFTPEGLRLGRGKGFYDRFLPKTSCPKYGLAFPQQIVPALPSDPWDIPLDGVIWTANHTLAEKTE